nr:alginate lyase family protein [Marinicella sp. W31]MDC2878126.1 alginate lyase family protein [Marinicella sp. W31]
MAELSDQQSKPLKLWRACAARGGIDLARGVLVAGVASFLCASAQAQATKSDDSLCPAFPAPTVTLDYGSRYEESSRDRSELDTESNAYVDEALKDADSFIRLLDGLANEVQASPVLARERADCIISGIFDWAKAGAFSQLETDNAKMTYASRVAGIASAYRQVRGSADDRAEEKAVIERWIRQNAEFLINFWNGDAPPKAKMGNLRLWAAYAVTEAALILREPEFVNWAMESHRTVLATEAADGSLPYEMRRGTYALHYQIHALAPLTASVALLCHNDYSYSLKSKRRSEMRLRLRLKASQILPGSRR